MLAAMWAEPRPGGLDLHRNDIGRVSKIGSVKVTFGRISAR